jgi:hypothetical protein
LRFAFASYADFSQAFGVGQERGGIAAVAGDGEAQFIPGGGIHQAGHDGEIEADIEEGGPRPSWPQIWANPRLSKRLSYAASPGMEGVPLGFPGPDTRVQFEVMPKSPVPGLVHR